MTLHCFFFRFDVLHIHTFSQSQSYLLKISPKAITKNIFRVKFIKKVSELTDLLNVIFIKQQLFFIRLFVLSFKNRRRMGRFLFRLQIERQLNQSRLVRNFSLLLLFKKIQPTKNVLLLFLTCLTQSNTFSIRLRRNLLLFHCLKVLISNSNVHQQLTVVHICLEIDIIPILDKVST